MLESSEFEDTHVLHSLTPSTESKTDSPETTERLSHSPHRSSLFTQTSKEETQTVTESTQINSYMTANTISSLSDVTKDDEQTSGFTRYFSTPGVLQTTKGQNSPAADISRETYTSPTTYTLFHDNSPTDSATVPALLSSSTTTDSSTLPHMLQTHTTFPDNTQTSSTSPDTESSMHSTLVNHETTPVPLQPTSLPHAHHGLLLPTSTNISPTYKQFRTFITTEYTSEHPTVNSDYGEVKAENGGESWQWSSTPRPLSTLRPSQQNSLALTPSTVTSPPSWSSTSSPVFYIVPNQPAAIRGSVHMTFVSICL